MSSPELILHIGTEKTGTTSIQAFLSQNRAALASQSVVVPSFFNGDNHSLVPCLFYSRDRVDELTLLHGVSSPADRIARRAAVLDMINTSAEQNSDAKFIFTSEHFQSRLFHEDEIAALRDWLSPTFNSIKILLYIRNPIDTAVSAWSTAVKAGSQATTFPAPSEQYVNHLCSHRETIKRWADIFGSRNLSVRLFKSDAFIGGDLIKDFIAACHIKDCQQFKYPPRINERLGYEGLLLLAKINKYIPPLNGKTINPLRRDLTAFFESEFGNSAPYQPSPKEREAYSHWFRDSDQWVKCHFFSDLSCLWGELSPSQAQGGQPSHNKTVSANTPLPTGIGSTGESVDRLLMLLINVWLQKHERIIHLEKIASTRRAKLEKIKRIVKDCKAFLRVYENQQS